MYLPRELDLFGVVRVREAKSKQPLVRQVLATPSYTRERSDSTRPSDLTSTFFAPLPFLRHRGRIVCDLTVQDFRVQVSGFRVQGL